MKSYNLKPLLLALSMILPSIAFAEESYEGKSQAEIQGMMTQLEATQKDYMAKQQALVTYQQAAAKELSEKENSLLKPIEDKVKASIDKVAAAKGLKYVVEKSMFLYANGIDITADVKKDLGIK